MAKSATPAKKAAKASKAPAAKSSGLLADIGGLPFNVAVLALAAGVYYLQTNVDVKALLPPAAPNKPYSTFEDFFPFYLKEHSDSTNRGLHFIGSSIGLLIAVLNPMCIPAILLSGWVGISVSPWLRSLPHGGVEAAIVFGLFFLLGSKWNKSILPVLLIPLFGYTFAWVGHFYYEHNKPASFIYPTYSLFGDFKMVYLIAKGEYSIFDA